MAKKKISEFNHNIVQSDDADGTLNLFDLNNPDINLFNAIDDELIKVSGSKLRIFPASAIRSVPDLWFEDVITTSAPNDFAWSLIFSESVAIYIAEAFDLFANSKTRDIKDLP